MSSHMIRGRQLSRDTEHRAALRRNMAQSLFEHGKIRTTLPKAKEVRAFVEKLITLARTDSVNNRRRVTQLMHDRRLVDEEQEFTGEKVVQKLFKDVRPQVFGSRRRVYPHHQAQRLSHRRRWQSGDSPAFDRRVKPTGSARRSAGLRRKRNERKHQFASRILKQRKGSETAPAETAPASDTPAAGA